MADGIAYCDGGVSADELSAFYARQHHCTTGSASKLEDMVARTTCFVAARREGELIGIARGFSDGVRGFLVECKLDPAFQGPACVTRKDGRIEHDHSGIAHEMARRVIRGLVDAGAERIDVLAYGTEVDFCEDLGFRRQSGVSAMQMDRAAAEAAVQRLAAAAMA